MKHPIYRLNYLKSENVPDKIQVEGWTVEFFQWLFCIRREYSDYDFFIQKEAELEALLQLILVETGLEPDKIVSVLQGLKEGIVLLHEELEEDLAAILHFDPAAKSRSEVLTAYPGFYAIAIYRLAHRLWTLDVPVLPRLMVAYVHGKTGIDIHPAAKIGSRFFIDHGTGIVIGETSIIGDDVKIYQGVTLGALSVSKEKATEKRHPTIGNDVTLYANATILGGDTHIGDGSVIGGNVWITRSVPPNSLVYHKSEISIKTREIFPEPLNFII